MDDDVLTLIKVLIPMAILLSFFYYFKVIQKKRIDADKRITFCRIEGKRFDSFKTDISSPNFKIYTIIFSDNFGNELEISTNDKKIFNSLKPGQTGKLTHGLGHLVDFEPDSQ
ncbi:hypothetical protein [Paenibacillus contaminans]|uniref:DUF2500 domain-containing protein n=1 Tax=Paenibacillus contaminans TaxID=450362 RepID=A0A329MN34_9BACL|nr:hypothetical protein [Paenibacillus contaminans]RAV21285.1 hypothetical protein DQG23_11545 [Paenibacillus contaminans]